MNNMGSSCSSSRRRESDVRHGGHGRGRNRSDSSSSAGGRRASSGRFFSGRLCGVGDEESDDEERHLGKMRRSTRHSVDAEISDQSISHLYNPDDNYEPHPTDPTLRCPKSLVDLCIDTICRSLPDLDGHLPSGLPQDVVDRLVKSLTSHAALNSTTIRALSKCEVGSLSLANARGVSDDWLIALSKGFEDCGRDDDAVDLSVPSSTHSSASLLGLESMEFDEESIELGDDESRSTSSFVSASSTPYQPKARGIDEDRASPLLPSVLPPPAFFSLNLRPIAAIHPRKAQKVNLFQVESSARGESPTNDSCGSFPILSDFQSHIPVNSSTMSLTLLDLRGSQRLTDRGLIQLANSPLLALEVARLDNCHGITGRGLLAFSRSPRLHTLSLANCRRLTDEAMVNMSHCTSLMSLNLGGCRCLTDRTLEAISNLVELRQLDLSQCDLITDEGITYLEELENIEELSLGWCRLSDYGLEILAEQPNRSNALRTLRLARCAITDDGLNPLCSLSSLEELDLNGCVQISSGALGKTLEELEHLTSLDASYCPGILRSSWQGQINNLKCLELCYSVVKDSHIARLRSLPKLIELNLDSCLIGDWAIAHLVDHDVTPNLVSLNLADTDVSDNSMNKIARLKELRHLSLFYCHISNRGLKHFQKMAKLESLNLDSREIGDDGLRYLRNLPLKSLDLFSSRVTDLGCAYISKIKSLTSLELCGGGVRDIGCAHLASISNLESLNLSQNEGITNRGAASLAALASLRALNLSNTGVTSDALRYFHGLMNLQSLALYGCKDMEDSPRLDSLQSELPSLRCVRLNSASNEDGVIDHGNDEDSDEEEDDDYLEEDESDGCLQQEQLYDDTVDMGSVAMSDFEDARHDFIESP